MLKYRIGWKVLETGVIGHGQPLSKENAELWVEFANKANKGEIYHWLECAHDWESFCKHPVAFDPPEQWFRCLVCEEETEQPEDN